MGSKKINALQILYDILYRMQYYFILDTTPV